MAFTVTASIFLNWYPSPWVVEEAGGTAARIEVITTASMIPYEVGENYLNVFGKIKAPYTGALLIFKVI
jgi:hypothetical protein